VKRGRGFQSRTEIKKERTIVLGSSIKLTLNFPDLEGRILTIFWLLRGQWRSGVRDSAHGAMAGTGEMLHLSYAQEFSPIGEIASEGRSHKKAPEREKGVKSLVGIISKKLARWEQSAKLGRKKGGNFGEGDTAATFTPQDELGNLVRSVGH